MESFETYVVVVIVVGVVIVVAIVVVVVILVVVVVDVVVGLESFMHQKLEQMSSFREINLGGVADQLLRILIIQ